MVNYDGPPLETRWEPGESGNPKGRPKLSPEARAFRETTHQIFLDTLQLYGNMTLEQLKAEMKKPERTMFELIFGKVIQQSALGDDKARTLLIERLWGKPKELNNDIMAHVKQIPTQDLIQMAKETIICLESAKEQEHGSFAKED